MTLDRAAVLEIRGVDGASAPAMAGTIARLVRQGRKVIVVAGATKDRTSRDGQDSIRLGASADPHARAMVLVSGAVEASQTLATALTLAGVRVSRVDPRKVAPTTRGHTLDAEPRSASAVAYDRALRTADVVVVPAGLGVDEYDRPTYMGEEGGQIGALFLASAFVLPMLVEGEAAPVDATASSAASIAQRKASLRAARGDVLMESIGGQPEPVAMSA